MEQHLWLHPYAKPSIIWAVVVLRAEKNVGFPKEIFKQQWKIAFWHKWFWQVHSRWCMGYLMCSWSTWWCWWFGAHQWKWSAQLYYGWSTTWIYSGLAGMPRKSWVPVLRKNFVLIYLMLGTGQGSREAIKITLFQTVAEAVQEKVLPNRRCWTLGRLCKDERGMPKQELTILP